MIMKRLALIATLSVLFAAPASAAEYQLIAHPLVGVSHLSRDEISRLFLKKEMFLADGTQAVPVDLQSDSPIRETFSQDVHGKGVGAIHSYWQRQIFSGRGKPPQVKRSDAEVIAWVSSTPGAIGYVAANAAIAGVRVIEVDD